MSLTRLLTLAFVAVVTFDVTGLVVSLVTGSESLGRALVIGTPINAPFTFVAVQALIVLAAVRARGKAGRAAAVVLLLLSAVSVISGFEDGSYAADLALGERLIQVSLVAVTAVMGLLAAVRAVRPRARTRVSAEAKAAQTA